MDHNAETAEKNAQILLATAETLLNGIDLIEQMARGGWQAIKDEPDAYETAVLSGRDIVVSLKTLAMRIDRAALIKFQTD